LKYYFTVTYITVIIINLCYNFFIVDNFTKFSIKRVRRIFYLFKNRLFFKYLKLLN